MSEQEKSGLAASAVAATVEETVNRVASLPDHILDNQELLEGFALEAFRAGGSRQLARRAFRGDLQTAARTFGGRRQRGMAAHAVARAEAIQAVHPGFQSEHHAAHGGGSRKLRGSSSFRLSAGPTRSTGGRRGRGGECISTRRCPAQPLADIARSESETPGLGASDEATVSQLHPLTPRAASALLGKPGLGRDPLPGSGRRNVAAGQRLFHLAIPGRRPLTVPGKIGPSSCSAALPYQRHIGRSARSDSCLHLHQRSEGAEARRTPPPAIARRISDCRLQQVCCPQAATDPARPSAQAASDRPPRNTTRTISGIRVAETAGRCSTGFHYEDARMAGAWLL